MRRDLEQRVVDEAHGAALRMLRVELARLRKGEVSMLLEIWRDNKKVGLRNYERDKQTRLQHEIRKRMGQAITRFI